MKEFMQEFIVQTKEKKYEVVFSRSFDLLADKFRQWGLADRKICIISDDTVSALYASEIAKVLEPISQKLFFITFPPGESSKNIYNILSWYQKMKAWHFDRKTVIVALGGGVVGDMAGFAAATYLRGLPFVQVPTTLLAQIDSSIGGKVGVDFEEGKNLVGAFYQPDAVFMNTETLRTLPEREYRAGLAEMIKYGLILSEPFFQMMRKEKQKLASLDQEVLQHCIQQCCKLKAEIVSLDEKESGVRAILNFGHTIGHGIESQLHFSLLHGECVALGMIGAMYISMNRGFVGQEELAELEEILSYFSLPCSFEGADLNEIYEQMQYDKKAANGILHFVLLKRAGETVQTADVSKDEALQAIAYMKKK